MSAHSLLYCLVATFCEHYMSSFRNRTGEIRPFFTRVVVS